MAYGIQNLRRSNVYDQLTPGNGGGGDRPSSNVWDVDNRGSYSSDDQGPTSRDQYGSPTTEEEQEPVSQPGLAKLADVSVNPNKGQDTDAELRSYLDTVQGSYKPETRSRDRNDNLLDNFPTRGQPTKSDRAIAIMMSLGQKDPLAIQERVLQQPYYRDREEWKEKSEPFYKAAQLENTSNTNQRQVLGQAVTGYNYGRRTDATIRGNDQRFELGQEANRIKRFAIDNPELEIDFDGPTVLAINPRTGERRELGASGRISEREKLQIVGEFGTERARIAARGSVDAATIRANAPSKSGGTAGATVYRDSDGNNFRIGVNGPETLDKKPFEPKGTVYKVSTEPRDTSGTPGNEAKSTENRMERVYNTVPGARDVLVRQSDGSFVPKKRPEPSRWRDNSAEIANWDSVMKNIYPDYVPPTSAVPAPTVPSPRPGGVGPGREPAPTSGSISPELRTRAGDWLRGKYPVTEKNIEWAIRTGKVR